jgi:hypothetical protein
VSQAGMQAGVAEKCWQQRSPSPYVEAPIRQAVKRQALYVTAEKKALFYRYWQAAQKQMYAGTEPARFCAATRLCSRRYIGRRQHAGGGGNAKR